MASEGDAAEKPTWWERLVHSGTGQAVRWLSVVGVFAGRWIANWPQDISGWPPELILALLLLLPDAESIAFGTLKLEMRRTREEAIGLCHQMMQLQITQASSRSIGSVTNFPTDNLEVAKIYTAIAGRAAAAGGQPELDGHDSHDSAAG